MKPKDDTRLQGLPNWITSELVAETIEVWQPNYENCLTDQDAIEILLGVATLLDAIGDMDDETIPGTCKSF